jgi:F0F1-type ATP synthase membrane subunit c/vacuolar-type H+-ATPase subunit K
MSSEAVHHYLWRDYGLRSRKGWILTLTDTEALALLSFVTTLVAYTQSRVWHIERNIFNRLTAPKIQLLVKDERASISQGAAIGVLIGALTRRRSTQPETIGTINPCIGFIASLNILGFVILGIILPWSLSGGVESPLVLARGTGECVRYEYSFESAFEESMLADQTFRQCWNNPTRLSNLCTSMDGILAQRPKIEISREDICPFLGDICKNNIRPVSFEYKHLSLRDFGVHSTSKVLLSRRLTCSPLETEKFLVIPSGSDCNNSKISFGLAIDDVNLFGRQLNSCNGPNRFSNQPSYRRSMLLNRDSMDMETELDVWIQPDYLSKFEASHSIRFHPNLWRPDGQIFVLGLRVGLGT